MSKFKKLVLTVAILAMTARVYPAAAAAGALRGLRSS